eukprot:m.1206387 g.1206387  ORF g.1206387 m.1206387 type:complete len:850 (+) comp24585_c1_seq47:210-2759(+)
MSNYRNLVIFYHILGFLRFEHICAERYDLSVDPLSEEVVPHEDLHVSWTTSWFSSDVYIALIKRTGLSTDRNCNYGFGLVVNDPGGGVLLNERTANNGSKIVRIPNALYPSATYRLQVSANERLHDLCTVSSRVLPNHALSAEFSIGVPPVRDTFQWIWPPQDLSSADVISLGGTYTILGEPLQNSTTHGVDATYFALRLMASLNDFTDCSTNFTCWQVATCNSTVPGTRGEWLNIGKEIPSNLLLNYTWTVGTNATVCLRTPGGAIAPLASGGSILQLTDARITLRITVELLDSSYRSTCFDNNGDGDCLDSGVDVTAYHSGHFRLTDPTRMPTIAPTMSPTTSPSDVPTEAPTDSPSDSPTAVPTDSPTDTPSGVPTDVPSDAPTDSPSDTPTSAPSRTPTHVPSPVPSLRPTESSSTMIATLLMPTHAPTAAPVGTLIPVVVEPTALPTTAAAGANRSENDNESSSFDWWIILVVLLLLLLLLLLYCCWKRRQHANASAPRVDPLYGTVIPEYSIDRENPAYASNDFGASDARDGAVANTTYTATNPSGTGAVANAAYTPISPINRDDAVANPTYTGVAPAEGLYSTMNAEEKREDGAVKNDTYEAIDASDSANAAHPSVSPQIQSTYIDLSPPPATSMYDNADASVSPGGAVSQYIEIDPGSGQPPAVYITAEANPVGVRPASDYVTVSGPAPTYAVAPQYSDSAPVDRAGSPMYNAAIELEGAAYSRGHGHDANTPLYAEAEAQGGSNLYASHAEMQAIQTPVPAPRPSNLAMRRSIEGAAVVPTALKLPTDDYNSRLVADTSISPSYAAMSPGLMDFEESPPTPAGSRGRKRLGSDGSRVSMV